MTEALAYKISKIGVPTPRHQVFKRLQSLPPLPQEKQLLLTLINDDDVDLRVLADAIEKCPVVAGRIIGLSNAAYFGYRRQCCSVFEATVNVLGMNLVKNVTLGIVACDSFPTSVNSGFDLGRFWMSSVAGAMFARLLARKVGSNFSLNPDDAYLGGLLRDIGLLALVHVARNRMAQVFKHAANDSRDTLLDEEQTRIGADHAEIGAWLAHQWNLPHVVSVACGNRDKSSMNDCDNRIHGFISLSADLAMDIVDGGETAETLAKWNHSMQAAGTVVQSTIEEFAGECEEIAAISRLFSKPPA